MHWYDVLFANEFFVFEFFSPGQFQVYLNAAFVRGPKWKMSRRPKLIGRRKLLSGLHIPLKLKLKRSATQRFNTLKFGPTRVIST